MLDYQRLKEIRKTIFEDSQNVFSQKININQDKLSRIERGKARITGDIIINLMLVYKINPFYLYGISENIFFEEKLLDKLINELNNKDLAMLNINASSNINTIVQGHTITGINQKNNSKTPDKDTLLFEKLIVAKDEIIETKEAFINHLEERVNDLKDLVHELKKSK